MKNSYAFPSSFSWGTATSAFQIEGAVSADGRLPSVWDGVVSRTGDSGAIANDHYRRFEADLDLMAELGIRHYRLSVSWPRIFPLGNGALNHAGLAFYDRLIDAILRRGIVPYVTLYHWDHPQALEDAYGGFRSRRIADDMADYASAVVRKLGDRVVNWFTLNEIICCTAMNYSTQPITVDQHPPRVRLKSQMDVNQTIFHALLAHGKVTQAIRSTTPRPCRVALVDNTAIPVPLTESACDVAASRKAFQLMACNGQIIYPVLTGGWSPGWIEEAEKNGDIPKCEDGDFGIISQPLDFFGVNIYTGQHCRCSANGAGFEMVPNAPGYPRMNMPWLNIMPEAMYWGPKFIREECGFTGDFAIAENGCAADDVVMPNGEIVDNDRITYLRMYLRQLHRAVEEGIPINTYFLWSFMDNFEWTYGYSKRFGIVWNSFETQVRTPKASARWYSEVIRQNRIV